MRKPLTVCFLAAESVLYVWFLAADLLRTGDTTPLKFAAIALVAAMGLRAGPGRMNRIVTAALLLTLCADVFLLLLNTGYALGIALFLAVQLLYALRLSWARQGSGRRAVLLRLGVALAAGALTARFGLMTALPAAYIACFAVNLAESAVQAAGSGDGRRIRLALGLLLFFCCDLCVGAHNLPAALLPTWAPGFARVAMWGFYLPGQVLILSATDALGEGKR